MTGQLSCHMMAARDALPVLKILFLFFTGRGDSFLSPKEKEKNGGANRADRVVRPYKVRWALGDWARIIRPDCFAAFRPGRR